MDIRPKQYTILDGANAQFNVVRVVIVQPAPIVILLPLTQSITRIDVRSLKALSLTIRLDSGSGDDTASISSD